MRAASVLARPGIAGLLMVIASATLDSRLGPAGTSRQEPRFRATTNLVFRDVRVVDARGRVVMDLAKRDFRVFEDGVEQQIDWFVRAVNDTILTDDKPRSAPAEGLILPAPSTLSDRTGRILVILIDDLHLQGRDSLQVQKVLRVLRDEVVQENDLIAVVSTGYSAIEQNLTRDPDHTRLDAAIKKVMGSAPSPADVIAAPTSSEGPVGLRWNAHVAFRTAYEMLSQLEKITGRRKALFYVSNGYDFNPFEGSRIKAELDRWSSGSDAASSVNPFDTRGQQFAESDLVAELAELTRAANRANTVFYPIDPRGLTAGPDIDLNLRADEWWRHVNTATSSLQVLASETLGRAVVNTNTFAEAFRRINDELSDYYVIGYYSSNQDPMRRTRHVEMNVSRPGLQLRYQKQYSLRPGR